LTLESGCIFSLKSFFMKTPLKALTHSCASNWKKLISMLLTIQHVFRMIIVFLWWKTLQPTTSWRCKWKFKSCRVSSWITGWHFLQMF
jgi:hypothetical protein